MRRLKVQIAKLSEIAERVSASRDFTNQFWLPKLCDYLSLDWSFCNRDRLTVVNGEFLEKRENCTEHKIQEELKNPRRAKE